MRKIIYILPLVLALAACAERAPEKIEGTNKLLVVDRDGSADLRQVADACNGIQSVKSVQWVGSKARRAAIVECR